MAKRNHFFISPFTFLISFISHFSFRKYPFSLLCLALIFVLSFTPFFPETPFDHVKFMDKWTHFVMYGGTTGVIWWEHLRLCTKEARKPDLRALFRWAFVGMIILGGIVELGQAYCTTTRSGEWLDFLADSIGVLLGTALGLLMKSAVARRVSKKDISSHS